MIKDLNNVTILESLGVTVFSMVLVFLTLLIISYLVDLMRVVLSNKEKRKNEKNTNNTAPTAVTAPEPVQEAASVVIEDDTEIVAVIAAAIAAIGESNGKGLIVKNIKKLPDNDSTWSRAGKIELMR